MSKNKTILKATLDDFDQAVSKHLNDKYELRLYITGTSNRSILALKNLKKICAEYLEGNYELEIIDLYKYPALAKSEQIIAAPTLIKKSPLPLRRIIGDMSNKEKVLWGLNLKIAENKKNDQ